MEDEDVAIRSHYPSHFNETMALRYPNSPISPRRRRSLHKISTKNTTTTHNRQAQRPPPIAGQPWNTKNLKRIPQLTLKPHKRPLPPPSPLMSKRRKARSKNQRQSTLRAVQRWKTRKNYRTNHVPSEVDSMYSDVGKVCRTTAASLSNELSLFLCDVSGTMIKKFHEFDDDLSGELSKEEFEIMMDHLRKQENFKLSRQDADLLFLAFDDDQSGSITTREICENLFKCHHRCPTNILGQRLLPRKLREHHDEKHGLTQKPMGYSFEKHQMCRDTAGKIYNPLLVFGSGKKPEEYSRLTPTMPTLQRYQMSPSRRRFNFLYTSDIV